jgi:Zn-dependent protease
VEESSQTEVVQNGPPGGLPPEVEAELRRRLQDEPAAVQFSSVSPEPAAPAAEGDTNGAADLSASSPALPAKPGLRERLARMGPIGAFLAYLIGKTKYLLLVAKFTLPVLKTGGTMLLSIVVYAQRWGWPFAVGFVLCILAHEMGHVYAAWRLGMPVSAPLFIPGFGALILLKQQARSAWDGALVGIGGPIAGTLAGLLCLLLYRLTGSQLMLGLAFTGFMINLFNMAPIYPLDGGRITAAVSPRIWLVGVVVMIVLFATGFLHNPLLLLLIFVSVPRLWQGLKTGDITPPDGVPTTPHQRLTMGVAYVALCGLLVWLVQHAHWYA